MEEVVSITYGWNVRNPNNLATDLVETQNLGLLDWIRAHSTHISQLRADIKTQVEWFDLTPDVRNALKTSGNYLTAGNIPNGSRKTEHVTSVPLVALDIDKGNLSTADIAARFGQYEGAAYETASSCAEGRRWRVILPLAKPVTPAIYPTLVKGMLAKLKLPADACSEKPAQPQMLPLIFEDFSPALISLDGKRLDLHVFSNLATLPVDPATSTPLDASDPFASYTPPMLDLTDELLEETLESVDWETRETWLRAGMALHHQFEGRDEGLELWDSYSQRSVKYKPGECKRMWRGFRSTLANGAHPVTMGSLVEKVRQSRADRALKRRDDLTREIELCVDELTLRETLPQVIENEKLFDDYDRKVLAGTLAKSLGKLTGIRPKISDLMPELNARSKGSKQTPIDLRQIAKQSGVTAKQMTAGAEVFSNVAVMPVEDAPVERPEPEVVEVSDGLPKSKGKNDKLPWYQRFVYVLGQNAFYDIEECAMRDGKTVDRDNDIHLLDKKTGRVTVHASDFLLNHINIPRVENLMYWPGTGLLFTDPAHPKQRPYLNTWRPESHPEAVPKFLWLKEERKGVARFLKHLRLLLPRRERGLLLSWLAWVVQNEGKHANWAVVLQGPQGCGKSVIAALMSRVLGSNNTRFLSPQSVHNTQFCAWAGGAVLNVLEEIKITGSDRFNVANHLKPYITNPVVELHVKHQSPYQIRNCTNYLALTNYEDAIPIEKAERRYCVLFSKARTEADVLAMNALHPTHFTELFEAIRKYPGAFREYLMTYKPVREFNAKGHAPHTEARDEMIAATQSYEAEAAKGMLEEGFVGHNLHHGVLSVTHLCDYLLTAHKSKFRTRSAAKLLEESGWVRWDRSSHFSRGRVTWRGKRITVYVNPYAPGRGAIKDSVGVIAALDETLKPSVNIADYASPGAGGTRLTTH